MKIHHKYIIIFIFTLAMLLRIFKLDTYPVALSHDELNYAFNAKSIFYTGQNATLTASALLSVGEKFYDVVIAELLSYLIAPIIGPLPFSQFVARLPYIMVS